VVSLVDAQLVGTATATDLYPTRRNDCLCERVTA
jgi:hypothetical protein